MTREADELSAIDVSWFEEPVSSQDHQRIERLFFDGVLDPAGGAMRPGLDRPGHGLALRDADTERYRRG